MGTRIGHSRCSPPDVGVRWALIVCMASACLLACTTREPPPLSYDILPPPMPVATADVALGAGEGIRVLVDTSRGMRGFAQANERVFAELYARIAAAASMSAIHPVSLCPVGAASDGVPDCSSGDDASSIGAPQAFDASSATLSALLLAEPTVEAASIVDDAAVIVLVSDGIESAIDTDDWSGLGSVPCIPGPDTFCLQHALLDRIDDGYSAWLIALTLPFEGSMYPEREIDDVMWAQLEAHVATLEHRKSPAESAVRARVDRRTTSAFRYFGPRPILVLVLARTPSVGEQFSEALVQGLRGDAFPYELPTGQIHAIRLTGYTPGNAAFETAADVTDSRASEPGPLIRPAIPARRLEERGVLAAFECLQAGQAAFEFRYASVPGQPAPAGFVFEERTTLAVAQSQIPDDALVRTPSGAWLQESGTTAALAIDCLRLSPGVHPIAFDLRYERELRVGGTAAWWADLSTETTWAAPDKLFRTRELVVSALMRRPTHERVVDRFTLLFGRR